MKGDYANIRLRRLLKNKPNFLFWRSRGPEIGREGAEHIWSATVSAEIACDGLPCVW